MKTINQYFPVEVGYPYLKVYYQRHWYGDWYEFELSGKATTVSFEGFFTEFERLIIGSLGSKIKKADIPLRLRLSLSEVNNSFKSHFKKFLNSIKSKHWSNYQITIRFFGNDDQKLTALCNQLEIEYYEFPKFAFNIEKIEWYWEGMHPEGSPLIRYNPANRDIYVLEQAVGTPIYDNHLSTIYQWIEKSLNRSNGRVKVYFLLSFYDMITFTIKRFISVCAERFQKELDFTWFHIDDWLYEYTGYDKKTIVDAFQPFKLEFIDSDQTPDEVEEFLRKKYWVYFNI